MSMHNPPHPGQLLNDYPGAVSTAEAARRLGVTRATLSRIRSGKSSVTAAMAVRLGLLLGTTPEFWVGMQTNYDLWLERQKPRPAVSRLVPVGHNTADHTGGRAAEWLIHSMEPDRTSRTPHELDQQIASERESWE